MPPLLSFTPHGQVSLKRSLAIMAEWDLQEQGNTVGPLSTTQTLNNKAVFRSPRLLLPTSPHFRWHMACRGEPNGA